MVIILIKNNSNNSNSNNESMKEINKGYIILDFIAIIGLIISINEYINYSNILEKEKNNIKQLCINNVNKLKDKICKIELQTKLDKSQSEKEKSKLKEEIDKLKEIIISKETDKSKLKKFNQKSRKFGRR